MMKPQSSFFLMLLCSGQLALSVSFLSPKAAHHHRPSSYLKYYRGDDHGGFSTVDSGFNNHYLHQVGTLRGGENNDNHSKKKNNSDYGSLSSLSVSELKRIFNDRGVDYRDCLEKRDLVERILTSRDRRGGGGGV